MLDYEIEVEGATPDPWQSRPLDPNGVSDLRQWLIDHLASGDAANEWTDVALVGDVALPLLWDGSDLWVGQPEKANANLGPQFFGEGEAPPPDDGATELPPVDIQGRRIMADELIQQIIDDYNNTNGGGGGGDFSGGLGPPIDYEPPVSHDGDPNSIAAAATLAAAITSVDDAIDNLPDNAVIRMPDGSTMTGAEIKALWNSMSFHVTTGVNYGAGRGGANHGASVAISSETVNGYFAHGANGLNFLLLHEIAHNTAFARSSYNAFWASHLAAGGTASNFHPGTTGYFEQNERVANNVARILGAFARVAIPTGGGFPTHGY
jgi:hypothetical protein